MNRAGGLAVLVVLAGACAPVKRPPASAPTAPPPPGQVIPVTPDPAPAPSPMPSGRVAQAPPTTPAPPPTTSGTSAPIPAKAPRVKPIAPPRPAGAAPSKSATPAAPATGALPPAPATAIKPSTPTLDLGSMEQRLRDTKAIGVFTKLSLKNQVDDLLDEVRQYHQDSAKASQQAIRQQFEGLMLKVLSSLQSGDPQLADSIAASREALWEILMDPVKFSKI